MEMDDISVEPLTEADFYEEITDSAYSGVNFNSRSRVYATFTLGIVRLSLISMTTEAGPWIHSLTEAHQQ